MNEAWKWLKVLAPKVKSSGQSQGIGQQKMPRLVRKLRPEITLEHDKLLKGNI